MARPRPRFVPAPVKEALKGHFKEPQLADVAVHFFKQVGGAEEVAKILYQEFSDARPGSLMRQRILDLVIKVTRYANDRAGKADDLSTLTDDDLVREAVGLMAGLKHEEGPQAQAPSAEPAGPNAAPPGDRSLGL